MSKFTVIGIDPGKKGGISIINSVNGLIKNYNSFLYSDDLLIELCDKICKYENNCVIVYIENVHAMPNQGVVSMFNFGKSFGFILGVVSAFNLNYVLVNPQRWKKFYNLTSDKKESIKKCKELFPDINLKPTDRSRVDSDGIAESLLIAEYGRRCNVSQKW